MAAWLLEIGQKLNEGKTKQIFELPDQPGLVLVQSKDQITAGNAVRKDQMEGKAAISNKTTSCVFQLLQESGIKTAFVKQHSDTAFMAAHCEMIPIEWVCRRVATGSFLKRNPGVKEGYRFSPLKLEMFFKDDANNDPQWSEEQLLEAKFCLAGLTIGQCEVDIMNRSTVAIFEILEKAWATQNCDGIPTVFVAVAGRSNGLGPVMSGNTAYPVINCPPLTPDWGSQDVWSSLRMPSGLGCSTVLSPEAAAQFAAQIFGLSDHLVWCKLRASMLNTWVSLKLADKKLQACSL
uniref:PurE domain-containing protein n=1 Tax=Amphilophus citrinellus TaxID=61819 RepID=A0A3Q0TCK0_AMPCI